MEGSWLFVVPDYDGLECLSEEFKDNCGVNLIATIISKNAFKNVGYDWSR